MARRFVGKRRMPIAASAVLVVALGLALIVPFVTAAMAVAGLLMVYEASGVQLWLCALITYAITLLFIRDHARRTFRRIRAGRVPLGEVCVGRDGVAWEDWRGSRFASFHELVGTSTNADGGLELHLKSGRVEVVHSTEPKALAAAVAEMRAQFAALEGTTAPQQMLAEEDPKAWREGMRKLPADYREPALSASTLEALALDPSQTPLVRVGAALGASTSPAAARIRVALDEVADTELRQLMAAALEDRMTDGEVHRLIRKGRRGA